MNGKEIPFSSPLAGAGHYHASRLRNMEADLLMLSPPVQGTTGCRCTPVSRGGDDGLPLHTRSIQKLSGDIILYICASMVIICSSVVFFSFRTLNFNFLVGSLDMSADLRRFRRGRSYGRKFIKKLPKVSYQPLAFHDKPEVLEGHTAGLEDGPSCLFINLMA
ncbi:uncharacterized protein LOC124675168 [Lolium rigidum]|uniref:uncharacterized protein LOC124675168 n=1 Tax=Lolium rigidum TaxID=89674 RepID=UPI001F5D9F82|nr:uncharacterized protein LOC124675168 [Lolium rigidum]